MQGHDAASISGFAAESRVALLAELRVPEPSHRERSYGIEEDPCGILLESALASMVYTDAAHAMLRVFRMKFCPKCGVAGDDDHAYCLKCGRAFPTAPTATSHASSEGAPLPHPSPAPSPPPPAPAPQPYILATPLYGPAPQTGFLQPTHHESHVGVIVVVTILVLFLVFLFYPLPFSFSIINPGSLSTSQCHARTFDSGVGVSFHWSTGDGATVTFSVEDSSGNVFYSQNAASGSGSFTSNGHSYDFCMYDWLADSVSVSGTAPIL